MSGLTFALMMEIAALSLIVVSGLANLFAGAHADTTVLWVIAIYFHLRRREESQKDGAA